MGFLSRIFGGNKESRQEAAQNAIEEFITILSVYNQAAVVCHLKINDVRVFPEFASYKRVMKVAPIAGKPGFAERSQMRKVITSNYELDEQFLKDIDTSVKRNCKSVRDVQGYFMSYATFTQTLIQHIYTKAQYKIMGSMFSKKLLRKTVTSVVEKMMVSEDFSSTSEAIAVRGLRKEAATLGFDTKWMIDLITQSLILSRKRK